MLPNSSYNEYLKNNIPKIVEIYNTVEYNIDKYINHYPFNGIYNTLGYNIDKCSNHYVYNENNISDEKMVSIVMTTHDRIPQTFFTLDTISSSSYKNIQIIIVDDSEKEFMNHDVLKTYPFQIDYITIKQEKKCWVNPAVNYNIGFKYVKGTYVIIQNGEVCHVGDVIDHVVKNCKENNYLVFDVINTGSFDNNNDIHMLFNSNSYDFENISKLLSRKDYVWYQNVYRAHKDYHFLTAMHINDFNRLRPGFDYDFALTRCFDDDEFIFRIKNILKLNIINIPFDKSKIFGIHQHHEMVMMGATKDEYYQSFKISEYLYHFKSNYYNNKGINILFYKDGIPLIS